MLTSYFQWIPFSYFKLHLQLKNLKSELHGNVCIKILFLLEVMSRCGCCQEWHLMWGHCRFGFPGVLRQGIFPSRLRAAGFAYSPDLGYSDKCMTAQKVHPGSTNFNINIPYYCFAFILILFLPPPFLCPNLLLPIYKDLNYFFPIDPCFAASLSKLGISVTIPYVTSAL